MKNLLTTLVFAFYTMVSYGQNALVPDFKNQPMYLSDGKLNKLEKQTVENKAKAKALGLGGASSFILLLGENSPVVLSSTPTFYIKVAEDVDPETVLFLRKVSKANRNGREVEMMRVSAFAAYGAKGKSVKKEDAALGFTKVSDGVYSFTPIQPLESGEYAFLNPNSTEQSLVFAFGVR